MDLITLFHHSVELLLTFINKIGYLGIFIGMFLESTPVPIPSELIMIPAGMAIANNATMNFWLVLSSGVAGNVAGAAFSYYLALIVGRPILFKMGKYFFIKAETVMKVEQYFVQHGNLSILIGRLVIGVRHIISVCAGVAKMNFSKFLIYTTIGATCWCLVLIALGYYIGEHHQLIGQYLRTIIICFVAFGVAVILLCNIRSRFKKRSL